MTACGGSFLGPPLHAACSEACALSPAYATTLGQALPLRVTDEGVDLTIARTSVDVGGRLGSALTINGTVPGPLLRFREGERVTLRVTNRLDELTTLHWHGVLVPPGMDGVAGLSFPGIAPGETFIYQVLPPNLWVI